MKRESAKRRSALDDMAALKARRRRCLLKCAASLVSAIAVLICKMVLESYGIVAADDALAEGAVTLLAMVACIYAGTASIEASRCKRAVNEMIARNGLTRDRTGHSGKGK